jgi:hypothetical protein
VFFNECVTLQATQGTVEKSSLVLKGTDDNNPKIGHLLYTVLLPSALCEISKPWMAVFQLLLTINSRSFYYLYAAATKVACLLKYEVKIMSEKGILRN